MAEDGAAPGRGPHLRYRRGVSLSAPGVMAGKGKRVVPIAKDGGTLYRTSITGFSSRDQALALCDRLRASGGHCFVH